MKASKGEHVLYLCDSYSGVRHHVCRQRLILVLMNPSCLYAEEVRICCGACREVSCEFRPSCQKQGVEAEDGLCLGQDSRSGEDGVDFSQSPWSVKAACCSLGRWQRGEKRGKFLITT